MKETLKTMVAGMFTNRDGAEQAYNKLKESGYKDEEIQLTISQRKDHSGQDQTADQSDNVILSTLVAIGSVLPIPGIGLAANGPLAESIAEDGMNDETEGFVVALKNQGIEHRESGDTGSECIILGFYPHNNEDAEQITKEWRILNAEYVYRQAIS
jgi:hypothetical protein